MKIYKASELGRSHRCSYNREKKLNIETEKGKNFDKATIILDHIKKLLYTKRFRDLYLEDYEKLWAELHEEFDNLGYKTSHTAKVHAWDAFRQIARYTMSEQRPAGFPKSQVIEIFGTNVKVSPTLLFISDNLIEVVKLRCTKANLAQVSSKKDGGANNSLELYAMWRLGQTFIPNGREMTVRASFYYLKDFYDNKDKECPDEFSTEVFKEFKKDFFEKSGSVVYLESKAIGGNGSTCLFGCEKGCEDCENCAYPQMCENLSAWQPLDVKFKPIMEEFLEGTEKEECTPEMCNECEFKNLCSFNLPPEILKKEKVEKSVKNLTLSKAQEEAIYAREGFWRINAAAGSGKTMVVSVRVATMLAEGIAPKGIMVVTFTNAGCEEFRERIKMYLKDFGITNVSVDDLTLTTFNAFGDIVIKEKWADLGFTEEPRLIDDIERISIIFNLLNKHEKIEGLDYRNVDMNTASIKGAQVLLTKAFEIIKKQRLASGDGEVLRRELGTDANFVHNNDAYEKIIDMYFEYDSILTSNNLYEYEDQNQKVMEYLRRNPYFFDDLGYEHIIVDEFQDSNETQCEFIKALTDTKSFKSLMVVGDDSQAIYSFQGSTPKMIINFPEVIGHEVNDIYLVENHRSTPEIIRVANEINDINVNKVSKSLVATRPSGKPVSTRGFWTEDEVNEYIVNGVVDHVKAGVPLHDIAVIMRNKTQLLKIGTLLTKKGIQWVITSSQLFMENSRCIAMVELMKALANTNNTAAMLPYLNCLEEGKLLELPTEEVEELVKKLTGKLKYLRALPDAVALEELNKMAEAIALDDEVFEAFREKLSYRKSLTDLIEYSLELSRYGDKLSFHPKETYQGVVLTTAHGSKGLEWPVVYCDITKFYNTAETRYQDAREESRRLLFVTITRARDELYITSQYTIPRNKDNTYNLYLKECYKACGMEFAPGEKPKKTRVTKEEALSITPPALGVPA